jgi:hypothetical protein
MAVSRGTENDMKTKASQLGYTQEFDLMARARHITVVLKQAAFLASGFVARYCRPDTLSKGW